jgi:hypothetical protein
MRSSLVGYELGDDLRGIIERQPVWVKLMAMGCLAMTIELYPFWLACLS